VSGEPPKLPVDPLAAGGPASWETDRRYGAGAIGCCVGGLLGAAGLVYLILWLTGVR
jgi:hypothetical protein